LGSAAGARVGTGSDRNGTPLGFLQNNREPRQFVSATAPVDGANDDPDRCGDQSGNSGGPLLDRPARPSASSSLDTAAATGCSFAVAIEYAARCSMANRRRAERDGHAFGLPAALARRAFGNRRSGRADGAKA